MTRIGPNLRMASLQASRFIRVARSVAAALNDLQRRITDEYASLRDPSMSWGDFKEPRTYYPAGQVTEYGPVIPPPKNIRELLENSGYVMPDYRRNQVYKKDSKAVNHIKLTKVLDEVLKANPERKSIIEKQFRDREYALNESIYGKDLEICITHDPYDVAGMSTGRRGWTSCMELDSGEKDKRVKKNERGGNFQMTALKQVQYGGMCAYLITSDDRNIDNPIARIAIKRFESPSGAFIFKTEKSVYGNVEFALQAKFVEKVDEILNASNQKTGRPGSIYVRNDGHSYSDGKYEYILDDSQDGRLDVDALLRMSLREMVKTIRKFVDDHRFNDVEKGNFLSSMDDLVNRIEKRNFNAWVLDSLAAVFKKAGLDFMAFLFRHRDKVDADLLDDDLAEEFERRTAGNTGR